MKVSDPADLLRIAESLAGQLEGGRAIALLGNLGADCPVKFCEEAQTARIVRERGRLRIEVSPSFVERWLETPRDVLFVLLHEISHRVRGDLVRDDPAASDEHGQLLANIVADIRINSALCREILPEGCGLLARLYSEPTVPSLLLLPPHDLLARAGERGVATLRGAALRVDVLEEVLERALVEAGVAASRVQRLVEWYWRAWFVERCSHARLLRELRELLKGDVGSATFLGDHERRRGKPKLGIGRGAGVGGDLDEEQIELDQRSDVDLELRRRVRRALEEGGAAARPDSLGVDRGVVPGLGRRALVTLAAQEWPVFFETRIHGTPDEDGRVRVYIDVSGSTGEEWPRIYGLVRSLGALVAEPVFLFSTQVVPIVLEDVRRGRVVTDGGTDFDAVARHVISQRFRRALVITDGIGPLDAGLARELTAKGVGVYVLLTEQRPVWDSGIVSLAREVWRLPIPAAADQRDVPF